MRSSIHAACNRRMGAAGAHPLYMVRRTSRKPLLRWPPPENFQMPRGVAPRRPAKSGRHEGLRNKAAQNPGISKKVLPVDRTKTLRKGLPVKATRPNKTFNPTAPERV